MGKHEGWEGEGVLAKQLRIEMAELTDIGRRRNDNQDNLARRVPDDPAELDRDGALFVVADGMGGHAAGEIASTVAVQTICNAYFEAAHGEVLQGLAQAIKEANEAILTIARENAGRTGMGTTLVAAVLCQGILYIANIGDSRAYLLRNGKLRQLTEDHSWVAEQVRAGILTEEQARNHVHRNVITRSLGTQPNVTADVFVEPAREGDVLLLCSDGLHGYVSDEIIAESISTYPPDEAAQRLIDLANEAGGPDNITVSIFHIQEMAEASPEVLAKLQLLKDQPRPTRPVPIIAKAPERPAIVAPAPPEPLSDDQAKVVTISTGKRPVRPGAWAVGIAAVLLVIAFSVAAWDFTLGPFAQSRVQAARISSDLARVRTDINALATHSPTDQLVLLATDQQQLQADLVLNLTTSQRADIQNELAGPLATAVQTALGSYNAQAHIVPLGSAGAVPTSVACASQLLPPLVTVPAPKELGTGAVMFVARTVANQVVPISLVNGQATCGKPFGANIVAITGTGSGFLALVLATTKSPAELVQVGATGVLTPVLKLPTLTSDLAFSNFAFFSTAAVLVEHSQSTNADTLAVYTGATFSTLKMVPVPHTVRSLGFGHNGVHYLLLSSGDLATYVPGAADPVHVVGDLQIQPALATGKPETYTSATPVPTVPANASAFTDPLTRVPAFGAQRSYPVAAPLAGTPTVTPSPSPTATPLPAGRTGPSTALPSAQALTVDFGTSPNVAVADGTGHRVILLNSSGIDLALWQQYTDASQLDRTAAIAFSLDSKTVYALTDSAIIQIALPA